MFDIIIVNYNSTDYLLNCLKSVYASLGRARAEIFVQDNGSSDEVDRVREKFPEIKLHKNNRNIGFAAAVNQALGLGKNPYVVLLNPDTVIQKGFFDKSENFMNENPKAGIMGPRIIEKDGRLQNSARSFPTLLTSLFGRTSFLSKFFPQNPITRKNLMSIDSDGCSPMAVDWVSGAGMVVNRKAIESVGPLDDRFFLYWEDADWCRRMWRSGYKVIYFPQASLFHHTGGSGDKELIRSTLEFHKSAYRFFDKHKKPYMAPLKPFAMLGLLIRAGFVFASHAVRIRNRRN